MHSFWHPVSPSTALKRILGDSDLRWFCRLAMFFWFQKEMKEWIEVDSHRKRQKLEVRSKLPKDGRSPAVVRTCGQQRQVEVRGFTWVSPGRPKSQRFQRRVWIHLGHQSINFGRCVVQSSGTVRTTVTALQNWCHWHYLWQDLQDLAFRSLSELGLWEVL